MNKKNIFSMIIGAMLLISQANATIISGNYTYSNGASIEFLAEYSLLTVPDSNGYHASMTFDALSVTAIWGGTTYTQVSSEFDPDFWLHSTSGVIDGFNALFLIGGEEITFYDNGTRAEVIHYTDKGFVASEGTGRISMVLAPAPKPDPAPVPEPGILLLMGIGILSLGLSRRKMLNTRKA